MLNNFAYEKIDKMVGIAGMIWQIFDLRENQTTPSLFSYEQLLLRHSNISKEGTNDEGTNSIFTKLTCIIVVSG